MAGITVNSVSIADLLSHLQDREWLVPRFQRDFVWSETQVVGLITSILDAHPIGMITLWAQPDEGALQLEPLSIADSTESGIRFFTKKDEDSNKNYAILDGRQRSTAIAMAFGGFKATDKRFKYCGTYFLNVASKNPIDRVVFISDANLHRRGLTTKAAQISAGLFKLAPSDDEEIHAQWMGYMAAVREKQFYQSGELPTEDELRNREKILREAFNGVINTKLAVYVVPEKYDLGEICEIFETLNTTGTKVSTVDLIHSWLYADTQYDVSGPLLLRDWISDLGSRDGAVGWAEVSKRPELMAQIATACFISLDTKPRPRAVGGRITPTQINSVKANDLLATPAEHWKTLTQNDEHLANYLGDFQQQVAGGRFPWTACPYPVSAAIYVALRWHHKFDAVNDWGLDALDSLYRAFFWRNSLLGRYDQGFLTQLGTDLRVLKDILKRRQDYDTALEWASYADQELEKLLGPEKIDKDLIFEYVTDGKIGGALKKAVLLPSFSRPRKDLLNQGISIAYPEGISSDLHHIFPKGWCTSNRTGALSKLLDPRKAGKDWINSSANLMLLSRASNNQWKAKNPGQVLQEKGLKFEPLKELLACHFIDQECFNLLLSGGNGLPDFWERRGRLITEYLIHQTSVVL